MFNLFVRCAVPYENTLVVISSILVRTHKAFPARREKALIELITRDSPPHFLKKLMEDGELEDALKRYQDKQGRNLLMAVLDNGQHDLALQIIKGLAESPSMILEDILDRPDKVKRTAREIIYDDERYDKASEEVKAAIDAIKEAIADYEYDAVAPIGCGIA